MSRILYIGDVTENTHDQVQKLAKHNRVPFRGLIESADIKLQATGYYFTSIIDLLPKDIVDIAGKFDEIRLIDTPQTEWSHSKIFLDSLDLIKKIKKQSNRIGTRVSYSKNTQTLEYWQELFKTNNSLCIYPWITLNLDHGFGKKLTPCARSKSIIHEDLNQVTDWQKDPSLVEIRSKFKKGHRMPDMCKTCYNYEDHGLTGYRVHDSLDWIANLGLKHIDDLDKIDNPYFYNLRLSNKCNLMCRMCTPVHSHLLKQEFEENPELEQPGQRLNQIYNNTTTSVVNIDSLTSKHLVYLTGGEPTIMKEVYEFMRNCIRNNRTDFGFSITTNAQNLNSTFMDLAQNFDNLHFSVSIDGCGIVNDYVRWGSNWDKLIENCHMLRERGHIISWNHVPTIWGIHRTHELFEYISEHFPDVHLYLQYNRVDLHSAFRSPLIKQCVESMKRCQQTAVYWNNGKDCQSGVDSFLEHYESYSIDPIKLKEFFNWNDTMDRARGIKLADYIPELDQCREVS